MKIFLAFAFRAQDKTLVGNLDRLIASHGMQTKTGEVLGGAQLSPAVQSRIDECDALVGLATRRAAFGEGDYATHQWVLDEAAYARSKGKKVVIIVEDGVKIDGMYQPHEHIPFDAAAPVEALLGLSEALRLWKEERGRSVKVQILPPTVANSLSSTGNGTDCSYRLWMRGKEGAWTKTTAVPEGGGAFLWVDGVQDEHLIQVQIANGRKIWHSVATSQWLQVSMRVAK